MQLPLFPLHSVLFPGGRLALKVFEARYVDLVSSCLRSGEPFGVCLIRAGSEVGAPAQPAEVGTLARIVEADMTAAGVFHVLVEGGERFVVESTRVGGNNLLLAEVTRKPDELPVPVEAEFVSCRELLRAVAGEHPEAGLLPLRDEGPWLGYRLAEILPLKLEARQALLEMNDSAARLRILLAFMQQQGLA